VTDHPRCDRSGLGTLLERFVESQLGNQFVSSDDRPCDKIWPEHDEKEKVAEARRFDSALASVDEYAGDQVTRTSIARVLNRIGIELIDENGGGPGVRLRKRQRKKA
jgi:hypothetical protein